jgi:sugar phosphate isomerase/epimerase
MMKLSYNTNGFARFSIEETVETLGRLGYEGVEIARTHRVDELSKQDRGKLLKLIKSVGLQVASIQGGNPYLDEKFAKARMDLAVDLECPIVSVGCGRLIMDESKRESGWVEVRDAYRELAKYAAQKGVIPVIEPEPPVFLAGERGQVCERLIGRSEDAERMFREVGVDNLALLLDIGHVYVMEENVLSVIEKFGKKIVHVHMEDIVDRMHFHFLPGTGMVDFEGVVRALAKIGYKGFLSMELEAHVWDPKKAALECIQYMDSLLYRLGLK